MMNADLDEREEEREEKRAVSLQPAYKNQKLCERDKWDMY